MDYTKNNVEKIYKKQNSKKLRVKNKVLLIILRVIIVCILIGCFSTAGIVMGAYMGVIDNVQELDVINTKFQESYTSIIFSDTTGEEIARLDGGENREFASLYEIPLNLQNAFIAIEDERFYSHNGVDTKSLFRAVYNNFTNPENKQGASTITQQYIKNKLDIKHNTWDTKLQEQYLAIEFEKKLTQTLGSKQGAKEYILEQYLNEVGLGEGQKGVKAGAKHYFDVELKDLTLAECAVIAATTQNPTMRSPVNNKENNRERQLTTLWKMKELGLINENEYDDAVEEDVYSKIKKVKDNKLEAPSVYSYFNDAIIDQVIEDLKNKNNLTRKEASDYLYSGGLSIFSTQDLAMQTIVDEAFLDESNFPNTEFEIYVTYDVTVRSSVTNQQTSYQATSHDKKEAIVKTSQTEDSADIMNRTRKQVITTQEEVDEFVESVRDEILGQSDEIVYETLYAIPQPQAAMVIIDYHTGQVKAMSGGRGEKTTNRGLNRATQSLRQPGSVFKILASYAPAIDMGLITPATVIDDAPFVIDEPGLHYEPSNYYDPPYRGPNTVRTAIKDSMNIITVKNLYSTGLENCMNYLYKFGFTTLSQSDHVYSVCLGGISGVSQLELAAAYGTIANEGMYNKPILYTKVVDHDGNVVLDNEPNPSERLSRTSAYLLTNMMEDVVTSGTGQKAKFKNIELPIAGKTGTTTDTKDLMFVGYTPYYAASIWFGYDMPKKMQGKTEGTHSLLWSRVMEKIHENLEYKDFTVPDGIVTQEVCLDSGLLASTACYHDSRGKRIRDEVFVNGTQPTEYCSRHNYYKICKDSGRLPSEYCPDSSIISVSGTWGSRPSTVCNIHSQPRYAPDSYWSNNNPFGTPGGEQTAPPSNNFGGQPTEQPSQDNLGGPPQDGSNGQPQDGSNGQPPDGSSGQPQDVGGDQPQDVGGDQPQDGSGGQPQDDSGDQPLVVDDGPDINP